MDLRAKPFCLDDEALEWVRSTLDSLDLRAKAGQLFCLLGGLYPDERWPEIMRNIRPGGVLFRAAPAAEIAERHARLDALSAVPLLKAANLEEGGTGIATDGTNFGSALLIAATGDPLSASRLGEVAAMEAAATGCQWGLAPVADIIMNFRNPITNTRSFGEDPDKVAALACAYARALQAGGLAACPKHFPGDGVDDRDQHLHPTVNTLSTEEWDRSFGIVYRRLIEEGVLSIMAGHILLPAWSRALRPGLRDEELLPASLAPELLGDLLRDRLGFNGLITSDATIMAGFTQAMERRHAIPRAVAAGCDILLFQNDLEEDFGFLLSGIEDGTIGASRLDEAVTRVLALKAALGLHREKKAAPGIDKVAAGLHRGWAREAADKALTLVKDLPHLFPLDRAKIKRLLVSTIGTDELAEGGSIGRCLAEALAARGFEVKLFDLENARLRPLKPVAEHREVADLAIWLVHVPVESDQTVLRVWWSPPFVLDLPKFPKEVPTLVVSLGSPFHLQDLPRAPTYVNAYAATTAVIEGLAAKIAGEGSFSGVSPVDPFCGYPDTHW